MLQGSQAYLTTLTREIALMIDHTLSFSQNRHPDYAVHVDYEKFFQAFTIQPRPQHEGGDGDQSPHGHMAERNGVGIHKEYGGIMEDGNEDFDVLGAGDKDSESNNSRMGDGRLGDGEFYTSRTGDNELDNYETGEGNSELKNSRMGDNEPSDFQMDDAEPGDSQMDDAELGNSRMGNSEASDYRMGDETNVHTTGNTVDFGMNSIRPRVGNSNTHEGSSPAALSPLPWRNAPKPDGSNTEFNERLDRCRTYLHRFAMHTPYYLLNLKSKSIQSQDVRGIASTAIEKDAGCGKKQKPKVTETTKGQL